MVSIRALAIVRPAQLSFAAANPEDFTETFPTSSSEMLQSRNASGVLHPNPAKPSVWRRGEDDKPKHWRYRQVASLEGLVMLISRFSRLDAVRRFMVR